VRFVARRDLREQHRYAINYRADALAVANVALGCICERLHLHTRRHGRGARMKLREISAPRSARRREKEKKGRKGGSRVGDTLNIALCDFSSASSPT